jgi:integrase
MGKLTVKKIDNTKPKDQPFKITDGDGLQLRIAADGTKTWLVRYMLDGRERQYRLPEIYGDGKGMLGLKQAREQSVLIRSMARQGIDIQVKLETERKAALKQQEIEAEKSKTLIDLFEEWVKTVNRKDEGKDLRRTFTSDVFPIASRLNLSDVQPEHIETMLRKVVDRGANRVAVLLFADLKQMFRWGSQRRVWRNLFEDPTSEVALKSILPKTYTGEERTRTLSDSEILDLANKLPASGLTPKSQIAIWLMLSTCTRVGELIKTRWEEIDFETGIWVIPKENAKNGKQHTVFLSDFAKNKFEQLQHLSTSETWCFPDKNNASHLCIKSISKQIHDRQLAARGQKPLKNRSKRSDALILCNGEWTPHDLRRTGATLMQSLKIDPMVIERVLNHVEQNKLRRTYQTFDYFEMKKDAWYKLGQQLSELTMKQTSVGKESSRTEIRILDKTTTRDCF